MHAAIMEHLRDFGECMLLYANEALGMLYFQIAIIFHDADAFSVLENRESMAFA